MVVVHGPWSLLTVALAAYYRWSSVVVVVAAARFEEDTMTVHVEENACSFSALEWLH